MREVKPYKQVLSHGCLAACFLMIINPKNKEREEEKLLLKAMNRKYKFYVSGVPVEISKKYGKSIAVSVDNKYFTNVLKKEFKGTKVSPTHKKVSLTFIKELLKEAPVVCHIDDHFLGDYSHASHFIVIERDTGKKFVIVDPWQGKRLLISHKTLQDSIKSLKTHIKMCPLLLTIRK
jgi:ABC-type bacteriocin/lantibiotic exporter with double-glycine peptidase domain